MDEYLCVTFLSRPGEIESEFKRRISEFWTHMLRNYEDDYEKVYAELVAYEKQGNRLGRKYLIEADLAELLTQQLQQQGMDFAPIDTDEIYSKYEATPPEWFWIEH